MREDECQRIAFRVNRGGASGRLAGPTGVVAADAQRRLWVFDPGGSVLADFEIPSRVASLRVGSTRLVGIPYTNSATPAPLVDVEHYRIIAQLDERVGRLLSARWLAHGQVLTTGTGGTAQLWDGKRASSSRPKALRFANETQRVIDGRREAGETSGPMTVAWYAEQWSSERAARGVGIAQDDLARMEKYALPAIGAMPLTAVRPMHARDIVRSKHSPACVTARSRR